MVELHPTLNLVLVGAISMASAMISMFFLRFWKKTGDRFFLFFAASFLIEGLNRLILTFMEDGSDQQPFAFLPRLVAFSLIICAIVDKNWIQRRRPGNMTDMVD